MKTIELYISKLLITTIVKIFTFFAFILSLFTLISNGMSSSDSKVVLYKMLEIPIDLCNLSEVFLSIGVSFFITNLSQTNQLIPTLSIKYHMSKLLNLVILNIAAFGLIFLVAIQPIAVSLNNKSRDFNVKTKRPRDVAVNVVCKKDLNITVNLVVINKTNVEKDDFIMLKHASVKIFKNKQIALSQECENTKLDTKICDTINIEELCGMRLRDLKNLISENLDEFNDKKYNIYNTNFDNLRQFINQFSLILRFLSIGMFGFVMNLNFSRKAGLDGIKFLYTIIFSVTYNFLSEMLYNYTDTSIASVIFKFFIPQILITLNIVTFTKKRIH